MRDAWIEIDLGAVAHNVAALRAVAAPAGLCAVVKADAYGHGAERIARTALDAGAEALAVAIVEEGIALRREAGIDAPILLLSQPPPESLDDVVAYGLTPTLYSRVLIGKAEAAAQRAGRVIEVHLAVDTGMRRVGAELADVPDLVEAIVASPHLELAGMSTHFAVADDRDHEFTDTQMRRFDGVRQELKSRGLPCGRVHAANSAAALRGLGDYDFARCGIALYGLAPSKNFGDPVGLRSVLSLHSRVSFVKRVEAGEALSYGLTYRLAERSLIATVPLGYADGVRRDLNRLGGEVLIGGSRYPIVGTITMDQLLVNCGSGSGVDVDDEVVLLGRQGSEQISAQEWATKLDTITYEVVTGFSTRLPRKYRDVSDESDTAPR